MQQDSFDFDSLEPQSFRFKFNKESYILHEAPESVAAVYKNGMMKQIKFGEDGKATGMSGGAEMAVQLLAGCVRKILSDGKEQPLRVQDLSVWPSRVIKPLFVKAKEISDLEEKMDRQALHKQVQDCLKKLRELDQQEAALKNVLTSTEISFGTANVTESSSTS